MCQNKFKLTANSLFKFASISKTALQMNHTLQRVRSTTITSHRKKVAASILRKPVIHANFVTAYKFSYQNKVLPICMIASPTTIYMLVSKSAIMFSWKPSSFLIIPFAFHPSSSSLLDSGMIYQPRKVVLSRQSFLQHVPSEVSSP